MTIAKENRSNALSVRAKLRKSLSVEGGILNATETKQIEAMIARLTKEVTPAKKAKAKKEPAKKAKAKTSTKKAPVKKAA